MIESIKPYSYFSKSLAVKKNKNNGLFDNANKTKTTNPYFTGFIKPTINNINTTLSNQDAKKYTFLLNFLKDIPVSENSNNMTCAKQLEFLLKNEKLLAKNSNDKSTTLDNLYEIATTKRAAGLDSRYLISNTLDNIVNPRFITQTFGDIPNYEKPLILSSLNDNDEIKQNPNLMDVVASGTCAAASIEVNMADKNPAEYAR